MICVSLAHMDFTECSAYTTREEFVEFRFDLLDAGPSQVISLVSKARKCISTCREGGMSAGNRLLILQTALEAGTSYIDLDMETDFSFMDELLPAARSQGCDLILSFHDFEKTPGPEELDRRFRMALDAGADLVKIACLVQKREDLLNLFQLYRHKVRKVVIGMGEKGLITRVAAPLLGSEFTFASPGRGRETAPGQITREKLLRIRNEMHISDIT